MEMEIGERSSSESWSLVGGASAVLNLTGGSSIPVCYHPFFGSHDDLLLLEVDEKLLPDILHNRVIIRGQLDEEAVLCTPSSTYAMKFVGTSNSVFLIPPGEPKPQNSKLLPEDCEGNNLGVVESAASVLKVAPGSMELVQAAPRLDKLKILLNERPYSFQEDLGTDPKGTTGLYSWEDLVELVQASEGELRTGLRSLSAVEIDGYWRIIDGKSMDEVLNMILNNCVLYQCPLNAIGEDHIISVLEADGYSRTIVLHCLDTYGSKVENMGGCLWCLDERRVCLHVALRVLSGRKMKLENFMEKWVQSIPASMKADLKMLEGEVLFEKMGVETWLCAFSVSSLSSVPAERFAALFRERPKWEWKDLEPYIRDLKVPGLSAEALLIKYTRRSQPKADMEAIFSAR
ncbi:sister chromatid cohesion protein DCC1 [Iris pallida]|uniref:Sister chromatid cohesion protein DCC1 n=1 Tax=Iris pallida TaxID=29817 RepID=A0AAX6DJR2_IRIPA|nr:sister chromatid cohesion protein DCC1 [Iris pallida]KAJ6833829.1 sister chromatid cohesion protein DCC1 [Iris pallida]